MQPKSSVAFYCVQVQFRTKCIFFFYTLVWTSAIGKHITIFPCIFDVEETQWTASGMNQPWWYIYNGAAILLTCVTYQKGSKGMWVWPNWPEGLKVDWKELYTFTLSSHSSSPDPFLTSQVHLQRRLFFPALSCLIVFPTHFLFALSVHLCFSSLWMGEVRQLSEGGH